MEVNKLICPTIITFIKSMPSIACLLICHLFINYENNFLGLFISITLFFTLNFLMFEAFIIFKYRKLNFKGILNKILYEL